MFRITADTDKGHIINVHLTKDKVIKFIEIALALCIWRPGGIKVDRNEDSNKPISAYLFLNLEVVIKNTLLRDKQQGQKDQEIYSLN